MKPKPQFHRVLVAWVDRLLSINGGALEMMAETNVLMLGDFLIGIFISFMIELGLLVFLALFLFEKMMVQSLVLVLVLGLGCYFGFGNFLFEDENTKCWGGVFVCNWKGDLKSLKLQVRTENDNAAALLMMVTMKHRHLKYRCLLLQTY